LEQIEWQLGFIPSLWLCQNLQTELLYADGHFNCGRFREPDVRVKVDGYHFWCWNDAGLKFTDDHMTKLFNHEFPAYAPLTLLDTQTCAGG
jgi:hypothetical protein